MTKLEDVIRRGTNAARPAATAVAVGTLYYDTTNSSLGRSNGTSWESVEGTGAGTFVEDRVLDTATALQTTTSTTFVDVTGMSITLTTGARRCLIGAVATVDNTTSGQGVRLDIDIDGTRQGGSDGLVAATSYTSNLPTNASFTYMTAALTAASHTFKLQFRATGGTARIYQGGTGVYLEFWVTELP